MTIVNRMLNRAFDASTGSNVTRFADVLPSHWAYQNITEVTTAHKHEYADGVERWQK